MGRRRSIADELRLWVEELAAASTDPDARDAWAALDGSGLGEERRQIAGRLLIGTLLNRHAEP